ncbi:MAG: type I glyceraldehyde-3-phosphate dehydrogenase [Bacilli bacterium]|jgi:glyceraldehyde 3-phosphate dehydrogenase|nr:type I glyceraldehyde-3-phosphate dehydrogenase [Bacilli bacterium]
MIKVAINGFGRIGRLAFREMITGVDFDIVAINDLTSPKDLAYLLKYDTNHRTFHEDLIEAEGNELVINSQKRIQIFQETDPEKLPWAQLGVDLVLECTGHFTKEEQAYKHIKAGAKKVLISAPGKGNMKTIVYNVNEKMLDGSEQIVSAASCTTNCLAPVLNVLENQFGIMKGFMITVHAYTNDQATLDISHKKGYQSRRGRACAMNIIPTSTGAAEAIGEVIPSLKNKLDGCAYRVPVSDGSMIDITLELERNTTKEEINKQFETSQNETLKITYDPIVSSDIIGKKVGALVDGSLTQILEVDNRQLVKIVAWYDNELGYTAQMMRTAKKMF